MYRSNSPQTTQEIGKVVASLLRPHDVLILSGDLGAGKTQFSKGVAKALGVKEAIQSPTFNILLIHEGEKLTLFHIDLYRLNSEDELEDTGIFEILDDEGVALIEWGEPYAKLLAPSYTIVRIERDELETLQSKTIKTEPARLFSFEPHGKRAQELVEAIDAHLANMLECEK